MKKSIAPPGIFDRWAPSILAVLTAAVPLVFDFSSYDTFDFPKMMLVYFTVLILSGLWFWQETARAWTMYPTNMGVSLLAFLGVGLISCMVSIDRARSLLGAYRSYVYGWFPMAAFALLFYLTAQVKSERAIRWVSWAALVSGALAGLYGFLQYSGNEIFDLMPRIVSGRVWSSLGNPVYLGAICMMALPLALGRWNIARSVVAVFVLVGLVISLSRSAWLGSVASVVYLLVVFRRKVSANLSKILAGLLAAGFLGVAIPQVRGRLAVLLAARESSNVARIEGWKAGLKVWLHHPWLGSGPDTFFEAFRPYRTKKFIETVGSGVTQAHAHNEPIQVASTMGCLGFVMWLWVIATFLRRLKIIYRLDPQLFFEIRGTLVASLAAIFVQNLFNPSSVASAAWTSVFAGLVVHEDSWVSAKARPWPIGTRILVLVSGVFLGMWSLNIPWRAEHCYKKGIVMDAMGKPLSALASYQEAVRWRPDNEAYQIALSNSARSVAQQIPDGIERRGLWDKAWKSAEAAVQWHPANPDEWNNLGVAAMWLTQLAGDDKMPAAKSSFEKAIALDPVFVDAWANLAKWYHIAGDLDGEKRMWKVVLQLDPRHTMALQVLGYGSGTSR